MRRCLLATTVLLLLAGCHTESGTDVGSPAPARGDLSDEQLRQQARAVLDRYDQAVRRSGGGPRFVPVGPPQQQLGDWELANGRNKNSLAAGEFAPVADLPTPPHPTGSVIWNDGTRDTVPLVGAEATLAGFRADGARCDGCPPLRVTGARLTTLEVETTRGDATVPAWEYTLAGTAVRLVRAAVDPAATVQVPPLPWDPNSPSVQRIEKATTQRGGRTLTVSFTGAPGPGSEPCGVDYTAEAVQSVSAVAVIVHAHPHSRQGACPDIGAERIATVELAREMGERAVLEVQQGQPVPVTVTR
ncbi:hypothetical protein [Micromonospora siamensis]|uniref:Lipoprotein n=1 Tax=Micromonospora siamensis TaxID=299152 RepID=A0A1C5HHT6_9ACTN|nr:hypothetical protein [Micromonospora siamensis]SCG45483.1 hypothetical protein GA0074704_1744 [Micromonospora siamensis]